MHAKKIDRRLIAQSQKKEALYGDLWLLSYELGRQGYAGSTDAHVTSDTIFKELLGKGVTFFDASRRLRPLFTTKQRIS